jgi:LPS sulfotransferase NodH
VVANYLICATARSGSNLLCELLSSLGFAGTPEEHLWDPPDGTPQEPLSRQWPRVLEAGTGTNGVFGLKLLWYQMQRLETELPVVLSMPVQTLAEALADSLENPRYIRLSRMDRLRQAISFARALQTGRWRSTDTVRGEEAYDRDAIEHGLGFIEQEERSWDQFFHRQRIDAYRLTYEDIAAGPPAAVTAILRYLDYDGPEPVDLPPPRHRRQADDVTEAWLRRYLYT